MYLQIIRKLIIQNKTKTKLSVTLMIIEIQYQFSHLYFILVVLDQVVSEWQNDLPIFILLSSKNMIKEKKVLVVVQIFN